MAYELYFNNAVIKKDVLAPHSNSSKWNDMRPGICFEIVNY